MKNLIPAAALALLLAAASCLDARPGRFPPRGQGRTNPDIPSDDVFEEPVGELRVLSCGIESAYGTPWHADSLFDSRSCNAVLFEDSLCVLRILAGDEGRVGLAADDLYIIGDELYTSYCSADSTVIKAGGKDLLTFEGREKISGILRCGDDLYTLGLLRGGGFCFRKNGGLLQRQPSGVPGELYADGSQPCFSYFSGGNLFICRGSSQLPVSSSDGWTALAARYSDERLYTAYYKNRTARICVDGQVVREVLLRGISGTPGASFAACPEGFALHIDFVAPMGRSLVCIRDSLTFVYPGPEDVFVNSGSETDVVALQYAGSILVRTGEGCEYAIDGLWSLMSEKCLAALDGHIALALTSREGGAAAIWLDGEIYELGSNAYLTGISLEAP